MCITETKPIKMPDDDQYTGSETEPQLTRQEDTLKKKMQSGHLLVHSGA